MKVIYWNSCCRKKCFCEKTLVRCFNTFMLTAFSRCVCALTPEAHSTTLLAVTFDGDWLGLKCREKRFAPDVWKIKALPRERCCCCCLPCVSGQRSWNSTPSRTLSFPQNLQPNLVSMLQWTDILLLSLITPAVFRRTTAARYFWQRYLAGRGLPSIATALYYTNFTGSTAAFNWLLGCHYNFK